MRTLTTIRLDEADRAAIAEVRERYGVATDSDAIRLAVRLVARAPRVILESDVSSESGDEDGDEEAPDQP